MTLIVCDDDGLLCGHCGASTPDDKIVYHGEDYCLCPACSEKFIAHIDACHHEWDRADVTDDYGDAGHCCKRCGWFIEADLAVTILPFVCDGYVEVPAG